MYYNAETEDKTLVRKFLAGDHDAFAQIVRRHERPVFNLIYGMVHDYEDARDLAQQVFVKAASKMEQFQPRFRLFSWLYRIALNETLNFLERAPRFEALDEPRFAGGSNPERQLMTREFETSIRKALARIAPRYRALIWLKHFEGLSYEEISRVLELPAKTVKSRLFTGRRLLWEDLQKTGILRSYGSASH